MRELAFIGAWSFVAIVGGCGALIGTGWTPAGQGGGGAGTTPTGDGGAGSSTSVGAIASSSVSSSASGGCVSPAACPGVDSTCLYRTCTAGACGVAAAPPHTPCPETWGGVCDGAGLCVPCMSDGDCSGDHAHCVAGHCESCSDGVQNGHETDVDCGGECQKCAPGWHCKGDHDCAGPHAHCENGICTAGD